MNKDIHISECNNIRGSEKIVFIGVLCASLLLGCASTGESSRPLTDAEIQAKCSKETRGMYANRKSLLIAAHNCFTRHGVPSYKLAKLENQIREIEERENRQMRGYNSGVELGQKLFNSIFK